VNDTMITVVGNVVDSPRKVRVRSGSVTNFRLASTGRRFDGATQQWVDSSTFYVDVECWNDLSSHVSGSISKGDPVVVLGAISTQEWETDSGRRSKPQIKAMAVGHNLARGIASFTRVKPVRAVASPGDGSALDPSDDNPDDISDEALGEALDEAFGEPVDRLTGELLGSAEVAASDDVEVILRGRDYVVDPATLKGATSDDLTADPVHA
jgi:single-strand DNA-binding protein